MTEYCEVYSFMLSLGIFFKMPRSIRFYTTLIQLLSISWCIFTRCAIRGVPQKETEPVKIIMYALYKRMKVNWVLK